MADGDQGIIEFRDKNDAIVFRGVVSASVTITNGITPDVILATVPPFSAYTRYGYIILRYGQHPTGNIDLFQEVRRFNDVVMADIIVDQSGGPVAFKTRIFDRRWHWATENGCAQISGEYNIARKNEPIPEQERTPKQLAELCLDALGETNYDVSVLPELTRPPVKWDVENAAKALADLCDLYACEVSLRANDTVAIVKVGQGLALPAGHVFREDIFDPKEMPKKLRCVSAPVEWQVDLLLEPVGPETDENGNVEFIPIEELSYRPGAVGTVGGIGGTEPLYDTWLEADGDFEYLIDAGLDEEYELAKEHILKTWRTVLDPDLSLEDPDDPDPDEAGPNAVFKLEDIKQLWPLIPKQVETIAGKFSEVRKDPVVWGTFVAEDPLDWGVTELADPGRDDYSAKFHYEGRFRIDAERGLVSFPEPMLYFPDDPADREPDGEDVSNDPVYAKMFLRCTVNLRDKDTREPQRAYREIDIDPQSSSGIAYEVQNDVLYQFWKTLGSTDYTTNKADAEEKLDFYLQQIRLRYLQQPQASALYDGFQYLDTDGTLRQITYQIDSNGLATMGVEYNRENRNRVLTHKEFREREKLREALRERDRKKSELETAKDDSKPIR